VFFSNGNKYFLSWPFTLSLLNLCIAIVEIVFRKISHEWLTIKTVSPFRPFLLPPLTYPKYGKMKYYTRYDHIVRRVQQHSLFSSTVYAHSLTLSFFITPFLCSIYQFFEGWLPLITGEHCLSYRCPKSVLLLSSVVLMVFSKLIKDDWSAHILTTSYCLLRLNIPLLYAHRKNKLCFVYPPPLLYLCIVCIKGAYRM